MSNATSIAINDLTPNGSIAAPAAQILDTGTAPVTLDAPTGGEMDRVLIEVTNTAVAALTVTIKAGQDPPAFLASADVASANIAQNGRRIFGPFESARFAQAAGTLRLTFTPASGTIAATFSAYRLPKV